MRPLDPPFPRVRRVEIEDGRNLLLPLPRRLPKRIVHDLQVRHFRPDPLAFGVGPRHPLARRRVLDETLPVPDQHPGIGFIFIVEDAGAARDMAPEAGVTQARPNGPGIPSLFSSAAMALGLLPAAKARKMRRTVAASSAMISRSPRIGSPLASSFFTTR
jgi:hypothetical protein